MQIGRTTSVVGTLVLVIARELPPAWPRRNRARAARAESARSSGRARVDDVGVRAICWGLRTDRHQTPEMYFIARSKARGCLEELTATKERGQRRGSLRRGSRSSSRMSGIGSVGYRALLRWEIINTPDGVICQGGSTVSRKRGGPRRGRLKPNKSHWDRARGALILQELCSKGAPALFIFSYSGRDRSLFATAVFRISPTRLVYSRS